MRGGDPSRSRKTERYLSNTFAMKALVSGSKSGLTLIESKLRCWAFAAPHSWRFWYRSRIARSLIIVVAV